MNVASVQMTFVYQINLIDFILLTIKNVGTVGLRKGPGILMKRGVKFCCIQ